MLFPGFVPRASRHTKLNRMSAICGRPNAYANVSVTQLVQTGGVYTEIIPHLVENCASVIARVPTSGSLAELGISVSDVPCMSKLLPTFVMTAKA